MNYQPIIDKIKQRIIETVHPRKIILFGSAAKDQMSAKSGRNCSLLKAELIRRGWFLERTHDLQHRVDELRQRDYDLADKFQSIAELTCMNQ